MRTIILILIVSLFPTPLFAVEEGAEKNDSLTTMEEVVVTATRSEALTDKIGGSSITVITAEDIEQKKQSTVEEVLKGVPGIDLAGSGGPGTKTSLYIRGADSKNTLIMVDGIMFNDSSDPNRAADLGSLTVDNIERIEIVRGPMSVLYGSNATAGVINIITKKGTGKPSYYGGVEGGSYDTWKIFGGSTGKVKKLAYSVSASRTETKGFSIANDDNDLIAHNGNTSEKDGWKNTTLSNALDLEITPAFTIGTVVRYLDSTVELDDYDYGSGASGDRIGGWPTYLPEPDGLKEKKAESEQLLAKISIHNSFLDDKLTSDISAQTAEHDRDSFDNDGGADYDYDGKNTELNWQGGMYFQDWLNINAGVGYFKERMDSEAESISNKTAETVSYWIQDQMFLGESLDIVAGVRIDNHDSFGSKTTYRIAPAYRIVDTRTTFKANYGIGFRAPSLYELYSSYGNEDLQAEESVGWDFGLEQELFKSRLKLALTYFEMKFDERIDYDLVLWKYAQQPGDTMTKGVETVIDYTPVDTLSLQLTYTYNDTEDPDGERLVRRPLNKVYFNLRYKLMEKTSISMDMYWVGERDTVSGTKDKDGNSVDTLPSYTVVNLSATHDLVDHVQIYGRFDNLFDEEYEEAWSYATPGLSAYAGLKFRY